MNKLFVTMLTVLSCGTAFALPVGNPSDASLLSDGLIWEGHCGDSCDPCLSWCDAFSVRVGFYGDYVFNRHMEVCDSDDHSGPDIETFEMYTNAGLIVANFWDRFDVFATLGTTNFFLDTNASAFNTVVVGLAPAEGARFELETNSHFSWSVGARGTIWECGCTSLGIEGQYFYTRPEVKRITVAATDSVYADDYLHLKYHEWQVGLGISHRINMFVPYIAVKYARAHSKFDAATGATTAFDVDTFNLPHAKSKKHWGYAVGVSLVDCEKVSLTVEGRYADEKAVHVNGQIRF